VSTLGLAIGALSFWITLSVIDYGFRGVLHRVFPPAVFHPALHCGPGWDRDRLRRDDGNDTARKEKAGRATSAHVPIKLMWIFGLPMWVYGLLLLAAVLVCMILSNGFRGRVHEIWP
jgi:hypothetical protein